MRPNNQNKRSRGRNGGRKHSNPLSRNYESNGPDVKIRGNASHVAEKYQQLARDAQASGDSVMAENYLQHAEHYFRIISAAQAQNQQRSEQQADNDPDDSDGEAETETAKSETAKSEAPESKGSKAEDTEEAKSGGGSKSRSAETADADSGSDGEDKPRKTRRPRRKKASEDTAASSDDPSKAPQPDVGELPAFLTNSDQANAAE